MGHHQLPDAPRRAPLGPQAPVILRRPPPLPPEVGGSGADVAVLCPLRRQPLRLRGLLLPPRRVPHLPRRPRHQRHHLRRHRRLRRPPRRGDQAWTGGAWHAPHRSRGLDLRRLSKLIGGVVSMFIIDAGRVLYSRFPSCL